MKNFFIALVLLSSAAAFSQNVENVYVSDLESGFDFIPQLQPFLARELYQKDTFDNSKIETLPSIEAKKIGEDYYHGTRVLLRMAQGLEPEEKAQLSLLKLVPIIWGYDLHKAYALAIKHGVLIHNFSVYITVQESTVSMLNELEDLVRKSQDAFFIVAAGNEGVSEAQSLGNFPQNLAHRNIPNVLLAGNALTENFYPRRPTDGTVDRPHRMTGNWTEDKQFLICIGCESTTGSAAYLSRLVASIKETFILNKRPHKREDIMNVLTNCLPKAHFYTEIEYIVKNRGMRQYYRPSKAFLTETNECALRN